MAIFCCCISRCLARFASAASLARCAALFSGGVAADDFTRLVAACTSRFPAVALLADAVRGEVVGRAKGDTRSFEADVGRPVSMAQAQAHPFRARGCTHAALPIALAFDPLLGAMCGRLLVRFTCR